MKTKNMRKKALVSSIAMLLVAVGSMVISMGCVSFATSGGDLSDREIVPNYTGVSNVVSHLTQSGDAATCKLTLTRKHR